MSGAHPLSPVSPDYEHTRPRAPQAATCAASLVICSPDLQGSPGFFHHLLKGSKLRFSHLEQRGMTAPRNASPSKWEGEEKPPVAAAEAENERDTAGAATRASAEPTRAFSLGDETALGCRVTQSWQRNLGQHIPALPLRSRTQGSAEGAGRAPTATSAKSRAERRLQ